MHDHVFSGASPELAMAIKAVSFATLCCLVESARGPCHQPDSLLSPGRSRLSGPASDRRHAWPHFGATCFVGILNL